jgi:hypothetical protein
MLTWRGGFSAWMIDVDVLLWGKRQDLTLSE